MSDHDPSDERSGTEIAVVGMAGRFPGAATVAQYWRNLCGAVESLTRFSPAELLAAGVAGEALREASYVPVAGVIDDESLFDAGFFGYSPREAATIDPQQRVFLETAWSALEDAGYDSGRAHATVGVYAGTGTGTYFARNVLGAGEDDDRLHQDVIGNDKDFVATRVAYKLDLEGPAVAVQSACSTSLVAIHLACQGLLAGECDMALAGGVSIRVPQVRGYRYLEEGILSPDGHCRAFDADARGCVPGSGAGAVVLKRLDDALADGDCIHAVIRGSAINNDGARKVGFTAPRIDGQAGVIRAAQRIAGVDPAAIGYVEAHGTGTLIGDPIEVSALIEAFRDGSGRRQYCALGSVKTNIGHLDAAAGVAGFIKAVLAVKHGLIPPSLHFRAPNPGIDFGASPFFVNSALRPWPNDAAPRLAGISSFGIGGTNAHVVIEQPPARARAAPSRRPVHLVLISARSAAALAASSAALAEHLQDEGGSALDPADVAFTTQVGRRAFAHRRAVVCSSAAQCAAELASDRSAGAIGAVVPQAPPALAYMFPGQGSQHPGMAAGLYGSEPAFRACVDRCTGILRERSGLDLLPLLLAAPTDAGAARALTDTRIAQPALFTVEYAFVEMLGTWGLRAQALIGHSIGEYVAACVAGVFALEDAIALVAERGRLMAGMPPGRMLAIALARAELEPLLDADIDIAAENAPQMCVAAGTPAACDRLLDRLQGLGIQARALQTSHAFHSRMMDPILESFAQRVAAVRPAPPAHRYVSNLSGTWIRAEEATDPHWWARHLRETVRFADGLEALLESPETVLVEAGPGQTLSALARRRRGAAPIALAPAVERSDPLSQAQALASGLGRLWSAGAAIDWAAYARDRGRRIPLPGYPFERRRYWLTPMAKARDPLAKVTAIDDWFHLPSWKRAAALPALPPGTDADPRHWLLFADTRGLGVRIAALLKERGHTVTTIVAGTEFLQLATGYASVRAGVAEDMDRLLRVARANGPEISGIVHCWGVSPLGSTLDHVDDALDLCFHALLTAVQGIHRTGVGELRRLVAITAGAHAVIGTESLQPAAAAVLGAVRVLPAEMPQIACTHLDIDFSAARNDPLAADALTEILAPAPEPVVVLRNGLRWLQCFERTPLPAAPDGPTLIRRHGTYLITGGLRGVGLATAEFLARTAQARLILTGRTYVPALARSDTAANALPAPDPGEFVPAAEQRLERQLELREIGADPDLTQALADACGALGWRVIQTLAGGALAGRTLDRAGWPDAAAISPSYVRMSDALLRWQIEDGRARIDGDRITFSVYAPDAQAVLARARARFSQMGPLLDLLAHCADRAADVLVGRQSGLAALFDEDAFPLLRAGSEAILARSRMRLYHHVVRDLVDRWLAGSDGSPVRMLEVGAGEGHLAWMLAPVLAGRDVEYHFTDIGRAFVARAEREAGLRGIDCMRFGTLDLERDLATQSQPDASADMVLAFNVLHATRRLRDTLARLLRVLKPGGTLVLIEAVRSTRWVDFIWGMTEGWWHYEDSPLRDESPLLEAGTWRRLLIDAGFEQAGAWPAGSTADAALIIGRRPADAAVERPDGADTVIGAQLREMQSHGAELMVVQADVTDPVRMREVVESAEARFGPINGVFHSALVLNDGPAALKTRAQAQAVLAPKVHGTLVLADLLRGRGLDFFITYSSMAGIVGAPGQFDYAAASNVADAITLCEGNAPAPLARTVCTIDWGAWRETGMAARLAAKRGSRAQEALRAGMSTAEGVEALARILSRPLPHVAVCSQPLDALMQPVPAPATPPAGTEAAHEPAVARDDAGFVAPRDATERAIAELWQELLGVARIGAHENFFELGGDSVVGLQFIARARRLGLKISNKQLFQHQSVAALAAACAADAGESGEAATTVTTPGERAESAEIERLVASIGKDEVEDVYGLAPMQQGMLYHTLDSPGTGVYCTRVCYTLRGPLDVPAFARAWQSVVNRHPVLRTSFHHEDLASPLQVVHRQAPLSFDTVDLRDLDPERRQIEILDRLAQEGRRGFDLTQAPLLRLALAHTGADEYELILVHHHLLMDGWCKSMLFEDVFRHYDAFRNSRAIELPPPRRYREFIDWFQRQDPGGAQAYWRRELAGFRAPTPLVGDCTPVSTGGETAEHGFEITSDESSALQSRLRSLRLTASTAVAGAWALWLAHRAGADEVLFGVTMAGRPASLPDADSIMGLFINSQPLRARIERDMPLGDWLAALQMRQAEARQFEQTPLASIRDWSDVPRSQRLFETLVVFENNAGFHSGPERHLDIEIAAVRPVIRNSYPLTLRAVPGATLRMQLLYDCSRFSPQFVARAADELAALLRAIATGAAATPAALLGLLDGLRDEHEQAQLRLFKERSRERLTSIKRRKS
ncbi:MAG: SDR family NAD(P)-dependent oxidoreductase [Gammaproteobacteria bacterium]